MIKATGGGVGGQKKYFLIFRSTRGELSTGFYRIEKACSVLEILTVENWGLHVITYAARTLKLISQE